MRESSSITQNAIDLSLAAVRRTNSQDLLRKHRQAFKDAEHTFLNGDPSKGCSRVYEEIEELTRKLATKAASKGWWQPGTLDLKNGPWRTIVTRMSGQFNFNDVQQTCPKLDGALFNRIGGLTSHRNESGHKPRSRIALVRRDAQLRTRYEHASDVFIEVQDATRPLRL